MALSQKIERDKQAQQKCPFKKAKAIFDEFRRIVQRKENKCHMLLKYPIPTADQKIISKERMQKWAEYEMSDKDDDDFLMWALEAMKYLIRSDEIPDHRGVLQICTDTDDSQWVVAVKTNVILVMKVPTIDWATIEEEIKGSHFKTIRKIIIFNYLIIILQCLKRQPQLQSCRPKCCYN